MDVTGPGKWRGKAEDRHTLSWLKLTMWFVVGYENRDEREGQKLRAWPGMHAEPILSPSAPLEDIKPSGDKNLTSIFFKDCHVSSA